MRIDGKVKDRIEGRSVALGNARFLGERAIDAKGLEGEADRLRGDGATVIFSPSTARRRRSSPSPIR